VGITRDNFQGKRVTKLSYEGYIPMAEKEMYKLCQDAVTQYPTVRKIAAVHVIGDCPVGQASVILVAASPHRSDALQCCDYLINELKARIPIWKLEVYDGEDEQSVWKENIEWHHGKPRRVMKQVQPSSSSSTPKATSLVPPSSSDCGITTTSEPSSNSSTNPNPNISSYRKNNAVWALLSGVLGATASCCAKVAFASANDLATWTSYFFHVAVGLLLQQQQQEEEENTNHQSLYSQSGTMTIPTTSCPPLWQFTAGSSNNDSLWMTTNNDWIACYWTPSQMLPRFVALLAMILCNAAMVACFVEGLQEAGSIAGTALSTAANFVTATLWGYLVWQEDTTSLTGLILVITGTLCLLVGGQPKNNAAATITTATKKPTTEKYDEPLMQRNE
jgi:molybdopterin synthase catalytic subunit